jgi:uncharacterized membrane protein YkoI
MSIIRTISAVRFAGAVLLAGAVALPAHAQARATAQQSMAQEARVSKDAARMTALSKVPGGRMSSIELRRGPGGKLIYTALITENGKPAKTEVVIDAMSGAMISKRP